MSDTAVGSDPPCEGEARRRAGENTGPDRAGEAILADDDAAEPLLLTVPRDARADRLDKVLAGLLPEHSRSRLRAWIEAAGVLVNGKPAKVRQTVGPGDELAVWVQPAPEAKAFAPEPVDFGVVDESPDWIVVNKPAGLVTHPGAGNWSGTLLNGLLHRYPELVQVARAGIVHRLDKDTSGLLVVAKNDATHRALAAQFADHGRTGPLERAYVAFTWGIPSLPTGTVDAPLDRHPVSRERMAVRTGGRFAITHWERQAAYDDASGRPLACRLECRLETGRTHQIRVHLEAIGHPVVGDPVYGPRPPRPVPRLGRQFLHAARLAFDHPVSGRRIEVASELPDDLRTALEAARAATPGRPGAA